MPAELLPHQALVLDWWVDNQRDFPWRNDVTPYQMLCTEIMLWKTRAESVDLIWEEFFETFPDSKELASASEDDVNRIIAPLGLRRRSKYLVESANILCDRFGGEVPEAEEDLKSLKGVGDYVASAVRCFCFDKDEAIYDANVRRIMFRLLDTESDDAAENEAQKMLPRGWAVEWNYALLDLGAIICRYKPQCDICPLVSVCVTGSEEMGLD